MVLRIESEVEMEEQGELMVVLGSEMEIRSALVSASSSRTRKLEWKGNKESRIEVLFAIEVIKFR
jgi:hypothetical protein